MAVIFIAIVLVLALVIIAIVAVGMNGPVADDAPEIANVLASTARHLNGDAEPPQGLVNFFEEIPDLRPRSATSAVEASKH
ncbi:hypothetical protein [Propionicimonas paludicola]|nr:hypothetical protein [Propionicimonas paludicola]